LWKRAFPKYLQDRKNKVPVKGLNGSRSNDYEQRLPQYDKGCKEWTKRTTLITSRQKK
jgi:hypothetical protein